MPPWPLWANTHCQHRTNQEWCCRSWIAAAHPSGKCYKTISKQSGFQCLALHFPNPHVFSSPPSVFYKVCQTASEQIRWLLEQCSVDILSAQLLVEQQRWRTVIQLVCSNKTWHEVIICLYTRTYSTGRYQGHATGQWSKAHQKIYFRLDEKQEQTPTQLRGKTQKGNLNELKRHCREQVNIPLQQWQRRIKTYKERLLQVIHKIYIPGHLVFPTFSL